MPIPLQVTGKNLEVSPAVREYLERRLEKVFRLFRQGEAKADLTQEQTQAAGDRFVVQVTLNTRGTLLRGEVRAQDLFSGIDQVVDVLKHQAEKFKSRRMERKKRGAPAPAEAEAEAEAPPEETPQSQILRVKRHPIKPMDPEEAVEQMELLGHDFFLFLNGQNSQFNVVYRRRGGGYGLIEPELG